MAEERGDEAGEIRELVEEATFAFTLGENDEALEKLHRAVAAAPGSFAAWHALAEVRFAAADLDGALEAADRAYAIDPDDIHINTSLSRIWVERGDKDEAERYGARARTLSWKEELRSPPPAAEA